MIQMHHEMKEILIICLEGREKRGKRREWKDKTYIIFFVFFRESFNLWLNQTEIPIKGESGKIKHI